MKKIFNIMLLIIILISLFSFNIQALVPYQNVCWILSNGTTCINGTSGNNTLTGVKIDWSNILNPQSGNGGGINYVFNLPYLYNQSNQVFVNESSLNSTINSIVSQNVVTQYTLYFRNVSSQVNNYLWMNSFYPSTPISIFNFSDVQNGQTLFSFASNDSLGFLKLNQGELVSHIYALQISGNKDIYLYSTVYVLHANNSIEKICTTVNSLKITNSLSNLKMGCNIPEFNLNKDTDILLLNISANIIGGGSASSLEFMIDDAMGCGLDLPVTRISTTSVQSINGKTGNVVLNSSDVNAVDLNSSGWIDLTQHEWSYDGNTGYMWNTLFGNVGIGTNNPQTALHVMRDGGGADVEVVRIDGNNPADHPYITLGENAAGYHGGAISYNKETDSFVIARHGGQVGNILLAPAGGNIGIGADNPSEALQVNGAVRVTGTAGTNAANVADFDIAGNTARIISRGPDAGTAGSFEVNIASSDASINSVPLYINSNGNIGIGTGIDNIQATLEVKSPTSGDGSNALSIVDSNNIEQANIRNDGNAFFANQLLVGNGDPFDGIYSPSYSSDINNIIRYKNWNGDTKMTLDMTSGQGDLSITGNVGINNLLPQKRLDISTDSPDQIIRLNDNSISHGMTNIVPTSSIGDIGDASGFGGIGIRGFSQDDNQAFIFEGNDGGEGDLINPVIDFRAYKRNGTDRVAVTENDTAFQFNSGLTPILIVKGNGDLNASGKICDGFGKCIGSDINVPNLTDENYNLNVNNITAKYITASSAKFSNLTYPQQVGCVLTDTEMASGSYDLVVSGGEVIIPTVPVHIRSAEGDNEIYHTTCIGGTSGQGGIPNLTQGYNVTNFVVCDWNSGQPMFTVTTDSSLINTYNYFQYATVEKTSSNGVHPQENCNKGFSKTEEITNDEKYISLGNYKVISGFDSLNINASGNVIAAGGSIKAGSWIHNIPTTTNNTRFFQLFSNSDGSPNATNGLGKPVNNTFFDNGTGFVEINDSLPYFAIDIYHGVEHADHAYLFTHTSTYATLEAAIASPRRYVDGFRILDHTAYEGTCYGQKGNTTYTCTLAITATAGASSSSTSINGLTGSMSCPINQVPSFNNGVTTCIPISINISMINLSSHNINSSNPTYNTLDDVYSLIWSSGITEGGHITKNNDGTINVTGGKAEIRKDSNRSSVLYSINLQSVNNLALSQGQTFVIYDYNAGNPFITTSTALTGFNCVNKCIIAICGKDGNKTSCLDATEQNVDVGARVRRWIVETQNTYIFTKGTAVLSNIGLNVTLSAGKVWLELASPVDGNSFSSFDTSVAGNGQQNVFTYYWQNSTGGWNNSDNNHLLDTTKYYNSTGNLINVGVGNYTKQCVYVVLDDFNSSLNVIYDNQQHSTLSDAEAMGCPSSLPPLLMGTGIYVGSFVLQQGSSSPSKVFVWQTDTSGSGGGSQYHNALLGIDGDGTQHISLPQLQQLQNGVWNDTPKINAVNSTVTSLLMSNTSTNGRIDSLNSTMGLLITNDSNLLNNIVGRGNWSADKISYNTTLQNNNLYYDIGNSKNFINSTYGNTTYYLKSNPVNYQNDTQINASINNALATNYFNPNTSFTKYGTDAGGNNIGNLTVKDNQLYNVTEVSGTNALEVYVNFTNISQFNGADVCLWYTGTHDLVFEILVNNTSTWEGGYFTFTTSTKVDCFSIGVSDGSEHIGANGLVQTRIRHAQNGIAGQQLRIDRWRLYQGITTQSIGADTFVTSFTNGSSTDDLKSLNITLNNGLVYTAYVDVSNKLNVSDQRFNDTVLANQKALPGNCPSGQVVQNTTTSGVQCITPPAGAGDGTGSWINDSTQTRTTLIVNTTNQLYASDATFGGSLVCTAGNGRCSASVPPNQQMTSANITSFLNSSGTSYLSNINGFGDVNLDSNTLYINSTSNYIGFGMKPLDDLLSGNGSFALYSPITGLETLFFNATSGSMWTNDGLNVTNVTVRDRIIFSDGTTLSSGTISASVDNTIIRPNITINNQPSNLLQIEDDFFGSVTTTTSKPFLFTGISSGTAALISPTGDAAKFHPGEQSFLSSTTASSGAYVAPSVGAAGAYIMNGSEQFEVIFSKGVKTGNTTVMYLGYHDSITAAAPVDGVYFEINNMTVRGIVSSNSIRTNTTTNYTIVESAGTVWYKARLSVSPDFSTITFSLYNSTSGNTGLLWNGTVSPGANVPTATGRETQFGTVTAYVNGGTTAQTLLYLDYMKVWVNKSISR